jgi:Domain found in Dishevelled, Egl-10, and Pleckstrin (DEP)
MLLLDESDTASCYLWSEQHRQPLPALQYQDKHFLEIPSSQVLDSDRAIAFARTLVDKTNGKLLILVVSNQQQSKVWREAPHLAQSQPVEAQELVSQFQLQDVALLMRSSPSLAQTNQRQGLRQYSGCFTGQAATQFLMTQYQLSQSNAIRLGQRLLNEHLIGPIGRQSLFTNSTLLYRFR